MDDLDLGATLKGFSPGQKVFNRYTLKKILGRGGMGVVWLARDEELERDIALKFLPEIVALDPEAMADLKRETRRNLDLTHPHIVRIYDFVSDSRTAAISMEYVNGASLSALKLDKPGRVFTVAELRPMLEQLCAALTYAHTKAKIVHRDLKPANLMVTQGGELKITDFGIARGISDSVSRVSAQLGGSSGTPVYMSPQQMMGEKAAVTDDIYAIGATLYELLSGKPPFHSGNIIMQVQAKVPPLVNERRTELDITGERVPPGWETLIAACLAKDASDRPQSAAEVAARLRGEQSVLATPPPAAATPRMPAEPETVVTPPILNPVPANPAGHGISGKRRWLLAPFLASVMPALACSTFILGSSNQSIAEWSEWFVVGGVGFLIFLLAFVIAWQLTLGLWRLCHGQSQLHFVGLTGLLGALAPFLVIEFLGPSRIFSSEADWSLIAWELTQAVVFGAIMGGIAGFQLRQIAFRVPFQTRLQQGLLMGVSLVVGIVFFGLFLPYQLTRSYEAEADRQYRAWEEQDRLRREAEDAKAKAEADALKLKREQETVAQRELREREAIGLIREAHRMVFDRAPDQALVTRYTNLMITNPDWGAARLRQELRKSPEGTKGGRLLVPEEFPTIRAAIEAAVPGNAVHVAPGVYRENILLNKAVNLIGAGRDRVTVETTHDLNALSVSKVSSGVIIRGFTFRHTGTEDAELRKFLVSIDGSTVIFEENAVLKGNGDGINLKEGAVGTIRNNVVKDNRWSGISLFAGVSGSIVDNVFEGNQTGIEVRESVTRMEIRSNQVRTSAYNGMWLAESDNVTLVDNRVTDNGAPGTNYGGIGIGKGRPILRGNLAHGNRSTGIWWRETASPNIQGGNISDGKELPAQ